MICRPGNHPTVGQDLEAMVCWFDDQPLRPGARYAVKHTTRWARGVVRELRYRLNINTLHREESAPALQLNEIGRIRLRVTAPLMFDSYARNRSTGSFILVDEATNATAGAGMILDRTE
jgi:bifunctional enzyme CysN/CysC